MGTSPVLRHFVPSEEVDAPSRFEDEYVVVIALERC